MEISSKLLSKIKLEHSFSEIRLWNEKRFNYNVAIYCDHKSSSNVYVKLSNNVDEESTRRFLYEKKYNEIRRKKKYYWKEKRGDMSETNTLKIVFCLFYI